MSGPIGFIGVGDMGGPMARRLLAAGHDLVVHDLSDPALEPVLAAGAARAQSAEVRTYVDPSTTGPTVARELREIFAGTGIAMLDCPVSGAMKGAEEGTLTLMISGPEEAYRSLRGVLDGIGSNLFYLGETPGGGQMMKLDNNYLSSMATAGTSEALVLGVKAGLDPSVMLEVINVSTGRNNATSVKYPEALRQGRYTTGGRMTISVKDIGVCLREADRLGVPMQVGKAVQALFQQAIDEGRERDRSGSILKTIEAKAGVKVGIAD